MLITKKLDDDNIIRVTVPSDATDVSLDDVETAAGDMLGRRIQTIDGHEYECVDVVDKGDVDMIEFETSAGVAFVPSDEQIEIVIEQNGDVARWKRKDKYSVNRCVASDIKNNGRIAIPIDDADGMFVSVRPTAIHDDELMPSRETYERYRSMDYTPAGCEDDRDITVLEQSVNAMVREYDADDTANAIDTARRLVPYLLSSQWFCMALGIIDTAPNGFCYDIDEIRYPVSVLCDADDEDTSTAISTLAYMLNVDDRDHVLFGAETNDDDWRSDPVIACLSSYLLGTVIKTIHDHSIRTYSREVPQQVLRGDVECRRAYLVGCMLGSANGGKGDDGGTKLRCYDIIRACQIAMLMESLGMKPTVRVEDELYAIESDVAVPSMDDINAGKVDTVNIDDAFGRHEETKSYISNGQLDEAARRIVKAASIESLMRCTDVPQEVEDEYDSLLGDEKDAASLLKSVLTGFCEEQIAIDGGYDIDVPHIGNPHGACSIKATDGGAGQHDSDDVDGMNADGRRTCSVTAADCRVDDDIDVPIIGDDAAYAELRGAMVSIEKLNGYIADVCWGLEEGVVPSLEMVHGYIWYVLSARERIDGVIKSVARRAEETVMRKTAMFDPSQPRRFDGSMPVAVDSIIELAFMDAASRMTVTDGGKLMFTMWKSTVGGTSGDADDTYPIDQALDACSIAHDIVIKPGMCIIECEDNGLSKVLDALIKRDGSLVDDKLHAWLCLDPFFDTVQELDGEVTYVSDSKRLVSQACAECRRAGDVDTRVVEVDDQWGITKGNYSRGYAGQYINGYGSVVVRDEPKRLGKVHSVELVLRRCDINDDKVLIP